MVTTFTSQGLCYNTESICNTPAKLLIVKYIFPNGGEKYKNEPDKSFTDHKQIVLLSLFTSNTSNVIH